MARSETTPVEIECSGFCPVCGGHVVFDGGIDEEEPCWYCETQRAAGIKRDGKLWPAVTGVLVYEDGWPENVEWTIEGGEE